MLQVLTLASRVFPPFVKTDETFVFPSPDVLFPAERQQLARANPTRIAEFAAGRECARNALARLGVPATPILSGPDRLPLWPRNVVGSMSHCEGYCGAVVASAQSILSLGFDAEPALPLDEELLEFVCQDGELAAFAAQGGLEQGLLGKVIFSAKESVFKCQYPLTRKYLEFRDVRADFDLVEGRFSASIESLGATVDGAFILDHGLILTGCVAELGSSMGPHFA